MRKKIFVRAPCLSQSGYGEQSRFALRALRSREDLFDIYVQPIPWGQTGWIWEDTEFRIWLDSRITQTQILLQQQQLVPDLSLQITIPNEFEKICPTNIGYTAGIETTKVAPVWLQKGNEAVDKILVVSNHAKDSYEKTVLHAKHPQTGEQISYKLETPVEVVWESTPRPDPEEIPGFKLTTRFNFLMVSQIGPRKNFENAIRGWVEEFIDQKVGLVIKTNIRNNSTMDSKATEEHLSAVLSEYPNRKCKVYLLHGDLTSGQMRFLYLHSKIKALINLAHGEGFGLPLFEAARDALPIITTGWSGPTDFLHHDGVDYYQKVKFSLNKIQPQAHWEGVIEKESEWAFPDQGSYKMQLRNTRKNWKKAKSIAKKLQPIILEKFADEILYQGFCDAIYKEEEFDVDNWLEDLNIEEYE